MESLTFGFAASTIIKKGRVTKEDVDCVSEWSVAQELPKITEEQIVLFLLSCQNNVEATKSTIKAYYSIRNGNPNIFTGRMVDSKELEGVLQTFDLFTTLDNHTEDGLSIIFSRLRDTDYRNLDFKQWVKINFMMLDALSYDYPPNGVILMFDMKGVNVMHLTCLSPKVLSPLMKYLQEAIPTRLVSIHILNSNHLVSALMTLIKPFLNADVAKKLHFHLPNVNMNLFCEKWASKDLLPKEYGGNLPPIKQLQDRTTEKLVEMKHHFETEEKQHLDFIGQKLNN